MEFYRFVEDCVRIFVDLMRIHYGTITVCITDDTGEEAAVSFDFDTLDTATLELNVEVGSSSYWSETMQTMTNDNLLARGIITDPILYVENIPDNQIRGKARLLRALREQKESGQMTEIQPRKDMETPQTVQP